MRSVRAEVDEALNKFLSKATEAPPLAIEAMRYSLFAGGKRLRPILTLAASDTVAKISPQERQRLVYPAACAIEMIHTYSLVHDDLPSMDNDILRRGQPTAHIVYGEGLAILAGDGLLTEAFRILAQWPETDDPKVLQRKLRVIERTAVASGVGGMVGGQVIDLQASGQLKDSSGSVMSSDDSFDQEGVKIMHQRKTGALIRASVVAGALMVGGEIKIDAVDAYGSDVGLAFQIVDDILDIEGASKELGKSVGKDAAAGKLTYPSMFGIQESRRMARSAVERAKASLESAGLGGRLSEIADWILARSH